MMRKETFEKSQDSQVQHSDTGRTVADFSHLMGIDSQARQRVDNLMNELESDPAPDKMVHTMV